MCSQLYLWYSVSIDKNSGANRLAMLRPRLVWTERGDRPPSVILRCVEAAGNVMTALLQLLDILHSAVKAM